MSIKKYIYTIFVSLFLLTGCFDFNTKEEVKKEIVVKKPIKEISVSEKKQKFKDVLVPLALDVYTQLESQYLSIQQDIQNNPNSETIVKLKKVYNVKTNEDLLVALKPHPVSILLAQAAAESAWLTSRFTKEANNIFGVWSFNKNEPRIAASGLRGDKTIYLKKYESIKDAIFDYYKNLGKNRAYKQFRYYRTITNDPYILSTYLTSYSEKKEEYTKLLKSMIKYNKFEQYDRQSKLALKIEEKKDLVDNETLMIEKEIIESKEETEKKVKIELTDSIENNETKVQKDMLENPKAEESIEQIQNIKSNNT